MIRKGIYSLEEVFSKRLPSTMKKKESNVEFDGDLIYMNSQRYEVFATSGIKCVCCGIEGKFFAKEKGLESDTRYHFNLYAIDKDGQEVLMTKDHIVPKSKGGQNIISNYQTMCKPCNEHKGTKIIKY